MSQATESFGKDCVKGPFTRPKSRWEDSIKMELAYTCRNNVIWMKVA